MSVAPVVVPIDAVVLRAGGASTGSAIGDTCAAVDGTDIAGSHHLRYLNRLFCVKRAFLYKSVAKVQKMKQTLYFH